MKDGEYSVFAKVSELRSVADGRVRDGKQLPQPCEIRLRALRNSGECDGPQGDLSAADVDVAGRLKR